MLLSSCRAAVGKISSVMAAATQEKLHTSSPLFFVLKSKKEPSNEAVVVDLSRFFVWLRILEVFGCELLDVTLYKTQRW